MTVSKMKLFTPVKIGGVELDHRVVMAPLTRMRSDAGAVPGDLMVEHYSQRASKGGLLIAEATAVSATGQAYLGAPGIFNDEQTSGWARIVSAVHSLGGKIFLQLWHGGRTGHVDLNGTIPVGPSVAPYDGVAYTTNGWVPVTPNRVLEADEIAGLVTEFRQAAVRAKSAGFDGVEVHAANGYIFDQFLQDGSNKRTDRYGGLIENRARLLLEVTDELIAIWGPGRVGVRISPNGSFNGMSDSNSSALFIHVADSLSKRKLAYLHVIEPRVKGSEDLADHDDGATMANIRNVFDGKVIAAGGFGPDDADATLAAGQADLIAFGRHFIANPDLPDRLRLNHALNPYDRSTFYGGDEHGYVDYPRFGESQS